MGDLQTYLQNLGLTQEQKEEVLRNLDQAIQVNLMVRLEGVLTAEQRSQLELLQGEAAIQFMLQQVDSLQVKTELLKSIEEIVNDFVSRIVS